MTDQPVVFARIIRDQKEARKELESIQVDPASVGIMAPKMSHVLVKIKDMDVRAANVVKQEMLAKGGEAAVAKWASSFTRPTTDVLLMGTLKQYDRVIKNLKIQPHGLKKIVGSLQRVLAELTAGHGRPLACGSYELPIGKKTLVMGIVNVTPDSFSERGEFLDPAKAVSHAYNMVEQGADIIDVGGESTRPGAEPVPVEVELGRVIPVIEKIAGSVGVPISIDTSKAAVAQAAIQAGAAIVNDVTALRGDKAMAGVCAGSSVAVILMHMQGEPRTMQANPEYGDLAAEIISFLKERIGEAVAHGIEEERILVDPGIGFGKTVGHNLEIIKRLREFTSLGRPVVLGTSRKSMIGAVLDGLPPAERVEGTGATLTAGILNGAAVVRVHDVKEAARVAKMTDAILQGEMWRG